MLRYGMNTISLDQARAAKAAALHLFAKLDVVGVGITRVQNEYAVKVNLNEPPPVGTELPSTIEGVPVRFEITGKIHAFR